MAREADNVSALNQETAKKLSVKVVDTSKHRWAISARDAEMDARATQAVKAAVAKAQFCKKPIAKYDTVAKRAYVEYANGERRYVN